MTRDNENIYLEIEISLIYMICYYTNDMFKCNCELKMPSP